MQIEIDIPLYRGYSYILEEYIEGDLFVSSNGYFIIEKCDYNDEIDEFDVIKIFDKVKPESLSIHIPNKMVDSEGNKIFASLNDKGTGADIVFNDITGKEEVLIFDAQETIPYFSSFSDYKVTGKIKV